MQRTFTRSLALSFLFTSLALGQDKDPPAAADEPAKRESKEMPAREEHVIYVPFQNLKEVFE